VQIRTPQSITTAKPLIASPPNRTSASSDREDEIDVITVRDMVELIDRFSRSTVGMVLYRRISSRVRSNTTTVSLSE
jgi:hypothetical protein